MVLAHVDLDACLTLLLSAMFIHKEALANTKLHHTLLHSNEYRYKIDVNSIRDEVPREVHEDQTQLIYIEQGCGEVEMEGRGVVRVFPGMLAIVPKGVPHTIRNKGGHKQPLKLFTVYL